jgi:hypothetical protein
LLWEIDINPLLLLGHPHLPRYLVAYPGFLLEDVWPGAGFSLYIAAFFAASVALLRTIASLAIHRGPSLLVYAVFIGAHLAMNGRGAIAWTAWLLCVWVCLKVAAGIVRPGSQLGWVAISCLLSAVSTGVFIVVLITFAVFLLARLRSSRRTKTIPKMLALIVAVPLGYLLLEYFLLAVDKNVEFFGGGLSGVLLMLEHGAGARLFQFDTVSLLLLTAIAFGAALFVVLTFFGRPLTSLERLTLFPLLGGLFGLTVLTLSIPLLLLRWQTAACVQRVRPRRSGHAETECSGAGGAERLVSRRSLPISSYQGNTGGA